MVERPLRCSVTAPTRSKTPPASSMSFLTLGAKFEPVVVAYALRVRAKQAANEIIIVVLLGIDCNCASPWMAVRRTLRAEERPAVRKKRRTSSGAVGWLMTPP